MKRNAGSLALAALVLGLLAAGCGGGSGDAARGDRLSKADYLTKVQAVGTKMSDTMDELGSAASDPKAGAKQFEALGAALKDAADELAALNPPEDVQSAHEKFADGISMLGDDIAKAGSELKGDDVGAAMTMMADLASSEAMKKIQEAADELEQAGYNVG